MPLNLETIKARLDKLKEDAALRSAEYNAKANKKKNKPTAYTQKEIEGEIFVNDAMYFDIHREHSEEFSDLLFNGWPENLSKENLRLQKRYIRIRMPDMGRYVIKG
jgi:hypothetical protein